MTRCLIHSTLADFSINFRRMQVKKLKNHPAKMWNGFFNIDLSYFNS